MAEQDLWQYHRAGHFADMLERMTRELVTMTDLPAEDVEKVIGTLALAVADLREIARPVTAAR